MRILYMDIDTLRADHLSCYGYCRETSPNIDRIAEEGIRFENVYVSDAPCLPSRASLFSGRFGIHTGVVNHGGLCADMRPEGADRSFRQNLRSWIWALKMAGFYTVSVSPFAERHSAWWFYYGFREMFNPGRGGNEIAPEVFPYAINWLREHATEDNWFLHINFWDPHTPYRTPLDFGNPFEGKPIEEWLTEEKIREDFESYGPHSAQDLAGWGPWDTKAFPRLPKQITCIDDYVKWIDGYDVGIRYADHYFGLVLEELKRLGVLEETAIIISVDHGESQGEFNVYGDHHTADHAVSRVPLIIRFPGIGGGWVDTSLHYQTDLAPTIVELVGGEVPEEWDGRSFAKAIKEGREEGRDYLVMSQCAWSCQRSVRWGEWLFVRTYHDGLKDLPERMLFNLRQDPHMTKDLSNGRADLVAEARSRLQEWHSEMMATSRYDEDPLWTVIKEGGPYHTRGKLESYCEHLRRTGRSHHADALMARHGKKN